MPAIDFDGLFDRLGRIGRVGYVLAGDQAGIPAEITDLFSYYEGTPDQDLIGSLLTSHGSLLTA